MIVRQREPSIKRKRERTLSQSLAALSLSAPIKLVEYRPRRASCNMTSVASASVVTLGRRFERQHLQGNSP